MRQSDRLEDTARPCLPHTLPCPHVCRWITLILCGGIQWLKGIFSPVELADPRKLLERVEHNLPTWTFIGFLYYHASMIWATKKAIQVHCLYRPLQPCPYIIYHIPYTIYDIPFTIYHIPYTTYLMPYAIYHIPHPPIWHACL